MDMFRRLFIAAASAGLLSGLFVTLVHQVTTVPVIHAAEVYEKAADAAAEQKAATAPAGQAGAADNTMAGMDMSHGDAHDHGAAEWEPQDGFERTVYTVLADLLTGIGFSLLLIAAYAVTGRTIGWRTGFYWGLAGFTVFILAPGLGLPPEVPGTAAAPLTDRQVWWVATAIVTACALAILFYAKQAKPIWYAVAVALLVAPHLLGAPQPAEYASAAPESLAHRFIVATTVAALLFWAATGALTGFFYERFVLKAGAPARNAAG
jgi:cobalt transporter subunit CbtA